MTASDLGRNDLKSLCKLLGTRNLQTEHARTVQVVTARVCRQCALSHHASQEMKRPKVEQTRCSLPGYNLDLSCRLPERTRHCLALQELSMAVPAPTGRIGGYLSARLQNIAIETQIVVSCRVWDACTRRTV